MQKPMRGGGASPEEMEFIFRLMNRGMSISEIKIEMDGQNFPLRPGTAFFNRLRREFDAAKKVLSPQHQANLNPLVEEKRRCHFKDLTRVLTEWNEELGNDVKDKTVVWESLVPSAFSESDRHWKGSIMWQVTGDRGVDVWMEVERREILFQPLLEHMGEELKENFNSLKQLLIREIQNRSGMANVEITNLAASLSKDLELVLASRVFNGTCVVCRLIESAATNAHADNSPKEENPEEDIDLES